MYARTAAVLLAAATVATPALVDAQPVILHARDVQASGQSGAFVLPNFLFEKIARKDNQEMLLARVAPTQDPSGASSLNGLLGDIGDFLGLREDAQEMLLARAAPMQDASGALSIGGLLGDIGNFFGLRDEVQEMISRELEARGRSTRKPASRPSVRARRELENLLVRALDVEAHMAMEERSLYELD